MANAPSPSKSYVLSGASSIIAISFFISYSSLIILGSQVGCLLLLKADHTRVGTLGCLLMILVAGQ